MLNGLLSLPAMAAESSESKRGTVFSFPRKEIFSAWQPRPLFDKIWKNRSASFPGVDESNPEKRSPALAIRENFNLVPKT
jgi:hypothetical protein